jgi:hypothetical protein
MTPKHLRLLQKLSIEVWNEQGSHPDYKLEKTSKNESVSLGNLENIWFFWNQFSKNNQNTLYEKLLMSETGREIIEYLAEEGAFNTPTNWN